MHIKALQRGWGHPVGDDAITCRIVVKRRKLTAAHVRARSSGQPSPRRPDAIGTGTVVSGRLQRANPEPIAAGKENREHVDSLPTGSTVIGGFLVGGKYGTSSARKRADHILTLVRTAFPCEAHQTMELPGKGIAGRRMTEDGQ